MTSLRQYDGTPAADQLKARLDDLVDRFDPAITPASLLWGAQFDLGLALVDLPVGAGGLGAAASLQSVVDERLAAAGFPHPANVNPIGIGLGMPTVGRWGAPDQRSRYLRPCFTADEI